MRSTIGAARARPRRGSVFPGGPLLGAALCLWLLVACGTSPEDASPSPEGAAPPPPAATDAAGQPRPAGDGSGTLASIGPDQGFDPDGNGLFEWLRVDVVVEVAQAGQLGLDAALGNASGPLRLPGTLDPSFARGSPAQLTDLAAGRHTLPVYFSGRALREAGEAGPYTVTAELFNTSGTLDTATGTTAAYAASAFQGALVAITAVSDAGRTSGGGQGYAALRVSVALSAAAAGDVTVQAQLFAGDKELGAVTTTAALRPGAQTIELDFAGAAIAAGGSDGPYTVFLTFYDQYHITEAQHTTAAYRAAEFADG